MSNVRDKVNEVYSEKNPSTYFEDDDWLPTFVENMKEFLLKLKIPPRSFLNSSLIDFGCGTGQKTIAYDHLGASCTLIEFDKQSYKLAKGYFDRFAKNPYQIVNSDIFDAKVDEGSYDFVLSSGVAHHTEQPVRNLELCCDALKPGGMLIFGIANKSGFFQRNLQRYIVFSISNNKEDIINYSKILFQESLERSVEYGGRTLDAVIWDTYLNPKIYAFGTQQIIDVFESKNLELYSSFRDLKIARDVLNPSNRYHRNMENPNIGKEAGEDYTPVYISDFEDLSKSNNVELNEKALSKLNNILPYYNSITDSINDLSFDNFEVDKNNFLADVINYKNALIDLGMVDLLDVEHNCKFLDEVHQVIIALNKDNSKADKFSEINGIIKSSAHLFREFNGVGMNYYCGYKR